MKEDLKNIVADIDRLLESGTSSDELSACTLSLISNDHFEQLPEEVQDAIYELDNQELNNLDKVDIRRIREVIIKNLQNLD